MKKLLKAVGLVAIILGTLSSTATAAGRVERVVIFWDSEDQNTIVGQNVWFCDGGFTHIGIHSLYTSEEEYACT